MKISDLSKFRTQPACVLLDLDNTFYSYEPAHRAGIEEVCSAVFDELNLNSRDFLNCFHDARTELKGRIAGTASSHNRLIYFQRAIERAGFGSLPQLVLQLEQSYWRAFLATAKLFPEALEFLDDLRIAGIPSVIITDQVLHVQLRKMLHFDIDRYVGLVVSSEETGFDKPHHSNFEIALAKLGGVEGPVWMVGDDPDKDIAGAKRAIKAITLQRVDSYGQVRTQGEGRPDAAFIDFKSLRRLLQTLKPLVPVACEV